MAVIVYVLVDPFSAVTTTSILLFPSLTSISPIPVTLALLSLGVALTFILVTPASKLTLYEVVFLLKAGSKFTPSIESDDKVLSEDKSFFVDDVVVLFPTVIVTDLTAEKTFPS